MSGAKSAMFDICPIRVVSAELPGAAGIPGYRDRGQQPGGQWAVKVVRDWVTGHISHSPGT